MPMAPLTSRRLLYILAAAAAAALAGAWTAQYGFGLHPCHLCMLQRYPYMALVWIAAFGARCAKENQVKWALLACALLFAVDSGIASYHAGVEWKIFPGPTSCTTQSGGDDSIEALRAQIMNAPIVACDMPQGAFLGLTMAAWNALYAGGLMLLAAWGTARAFRRVPA